MKANDLTLQSSRTLATCPIDNISTSSFKTMASTAPGTEGINEEAIARVRERGVLATLKAAWLGSTAGQPSEFWLGRLIDKWIGHDPATFNQRRMISSRLQEFARKDFEDFEKEIGYDEVPGAEERWKEMRVIFESSRVNRLVEATLKKEGGFGISFKPLSPEALNDVTTKVQSQYPTIAFTDQLRAMTVACNSDWLDLDTIQTSKWWLQRRVRGLVGENTPEIHEFLVKRIKEAAREDFDNLEEDIDYSQHPDSVERWEKVRHVFEYIRLNRIKDLDLSSEDLSITYDIIPPKAKLHAVAALQPYYPDIDIAHVIENNIAIANEKERQKEQNARIVSPTEILDAFRILPYEQQMVWRNFYQEVARHFVTSMHQNGNLPAVTPEAIASATQMLFELTPHLIQLVSGRTVSSTSISEQLKEMQEWVDSSNMEALNGPLHLSGGVSIIDGKRLLARGIVHEIYYEELMPKETARLGTELKNVRASKAHKIVFNDAFRPMFDYIIDIASPGILSSRFSLQERTNGNGPVEMHQVHSHFRDYMRLMLPIVVDEMFKYWPNLGTDLTAVRNIPSLRPILQKRLGTQDGALYLHKVTVTDADGKPHTQWHPAPQGVKTDFPLLSPWLADEARFVGAIQYLTIVIYNYTQALRYHHIEEANFWFLIAGTLRFPSGEDIVLTQGELDMLTKTCADFAIKFRNTIAYTLPTRLAYAGLQHLYGLGSFTTAERDRFIEEITDHFRLFSQADTESVYAPGSLDNAWKKVGPYVHAILWQKGFRNEALKERETLFYDQVFEPWYARCVAALRDAQEAFQISDDKWLEQHMETLLKNNLQLYPHRTEIAEQIHDYAISGFYEIEAMTGYQNIVGYKKRWAEVVPALEHAYTKFLVPFIEYDDGGVHVQPEIMNIEERYQIAEKLQPYYPEVDLLQLETKAMATTPVNPRRMLATFRPISRQQQWHWQNFYRYIASNCLKKIAAQYPDATLVTDTEIERVTGELFTLASELEQFFHYKKVRNLEKKLPELQETFPGSIVSMPKLLHKWLDSKEGKQIFDQPFMLAGIMVEHGKRQLAEEIAAMVYQDSCMPTSSDKLGYYNIYHPMNDSVGNTRSASFFYSKEYKDLFNSIIDTTAQIALDSYFSRQELSQGNGALEAQQIRAHINIFMRETLPIVMEAIRTTNIQYLQLESPEHFAFEDMYNMFIHGAKSGARLVLRKTTFQANDGETHTKWIRVTKNQRPADLIVADWSQDKTGFIETMQPLLALLYNYGNALKERAVAKGVPTPNRYYLPPQAKKAGTAAVTFPDAVAYHRQMIRNFCHAISRAAPAKATEHLLQDDLTISSATIQETFHTLALDHFRILYHTPGTLNVEHAFEQGRDRLWQQFRPHVREFLEKDYLTLPVDDAIAQRELREHYIRDQIFVPRYEKCFSDVHKAKLPEGGMLQKRAPYWWCFMLAWAGVAGVRMLYSYCNATAKASPPVPTPAPARPKEPGKPKKPRPGKARALEPQMLPTVVEPTPTQILEQRRDEMKRALTDRLCEMQKHNSTLEEQAKLIESTREDWEQSRDRYLPQFKLANTEEMRRKLIENLAYLNTFPPQHQQWLSSQETLRSFEGLLPKAANEELGTLLENIATALNNASQLTVPSLRVTTEIQEKSATIHRGLTALSTTEIRLKAEQDKLANEANRDAIQQAAKEQRAINARAAKEAEAIRKAAEHAVAEERKRQAILEKAEKQHQEAEAKRQQEEAQRKKAEIKKTIESMQKTAEAKRFRTPAEARRTEAPKPEVVILSPDLAMEIRAFKRTQPADPIRDNANYKEAAKSYRALCSLLDCIKNNEDIARNSDIMHYALSYNLFRLFHYLANMPRSSGFHRPFQLLLSQFTLPSALDKPEVTLFDIRNFFRHRQPATPLLQEMAETIRKQLGGLINDCRTEGNFILPVSLKEPIQSFFNGQKQSSEQLLNELEQVAKTLQRWQQWHEKATPENLATEHPQEAFLMLITCHGQLCKDLRLATTSLGHVARLTVFNNIDWLNAELSLLYNQAERFYDPRSTHSSSPFLYYCNKIGHTSQEHSEHIPVQAEINPVTSNELERLYSKTLEATKLTQECIQAIRNSKKLIISPEKAKELEKHRPISAPEPIVALRPSSHVERSIASSLTSTATGKAERGGKM